MSTIFANQAVIMSTATQQLVIVKVRGRHDNKTIVSEHMEQHETDQ